MIKHLVVFSLNLSAEMEHDNGAPWRGQLSLCRRVVSDMPDNSGFAFWGMVDQRCDEPFIRHLDKDAALSMLSTITDEYAHKYPGGRSRFSHQLYGARNMFRALMLNYDKADVIHFTSGPDAPPDDYLHLIRQDGTVIDHIEGVDLTDWDLMDMPGRLFDVYGLRWHVVPIRWFSPHFRSDRKTWRGLEYMVGIYESMSRGSFAYDGSRQDFGHFNGLGASLAVDIERSDVVLRSHK